MFVKNFVGAKLGALEITPANRQLLRSGYSRRRPEELPVLTRCVWLRLFICNVHCGVAGCAACDYSRRPPEELPVLTRCALAAHLVLITESCTSLPQQPALSPHQAPCAQPLTESTQHACVAAGGSQRRLSALCPSLQILTSSCTAGSSW